MIRVTLILRKRETIVQKVRNLQALLPSVSHDISFMIGFFVFVVMSGVFPCFHFHFLFLFLHVSKSKKLVYKFLLFLNNVFSFSLFCFFFFTNRIFSKEKARARNTLKKIGGSAKDQYKCRISFPGNIRLYGDVLKTS